MQPLRARGGHDTGDSRASSGYPWAGMRGPVAIILTVLAFGVVPATALGTPRNIASTHTYIRANYALTRATQAKVKVAQASIEATIHKLGQECPKLGVGSPQNEESQHLSYEVVVALWSASFSTDASPIRKFASVVRHLRWSNPKLTHMAQRYATDLQKLASLQMPNVCGDVTAWKESDYKTVPANRSNSIGAWKRSNPRRSRRRYWLRTSSPRTSRSWPRQHASKAGCSGLKPPRASTIGIRRWKR